MPAAGRLAGQSALYGLAGAVSKALALITVPILSRILGAADYGLADLATALAALAQLIVSFSGDIPAARLRALASDAPARRRVLTAWVVATAAVSLAAAAVLLPFSGAIAGQLWNDPGAGGLAALSIVLVPISSTQAAVASVLRLEERAVAFALVSILDLLAQLLLAVLFVLFGFGPPGVVLGFICGSVVGSVTALAVVRGHLTLSVDPRLAVTIVARGLPFLPGATLFVAADYVVRFAVVEQLDTAAVGRFAVAIRLASIMVLASGAFTLAFGPYGLARMADRRTAVLFGAILQGFALVTLSAAMVGGALGPELVLLVAGDAYVGAGEALPGLLLAAAMSGMFYILLVTAGVQERARGVPISAGIGSAVQVAATWLLIPAAGLGGVGVGAALGRATSLAILYVETRRTISINAVVASATVVAAIALAAGLQLLNVNPGGTLLLRLVIAAGTTLIAAAAALYWLAPRLSRLATETDPTA